MGRERGGGGVEEEFRVAQLFLLIVVACAGIVDCICESTVFFSPRIEQNHFECR